MTLYLPPFYGETTPAPDQRGGVGVDDRLMREPRLMVPRLGVIGNCKIDYSHRFITSFSSYPYFAYLNGIYYNLKTKTKTSLATNPGYQAAPMKWSAAGYGPYSTGFHYQYPGAVGATLIHSGFCLFWYGNAGTIDQEVIFSNGETGGKGFFITTGNELKFMRRGGTSAAIITLAPGAIYAACYVVNDTAVKVFVNGQNFSLTVGTSGGDYPNGIILRDRDYTSAASNICVGFGVTGIGSLPDSIASEISKNPMDCIIPA